MITPRFINRSDFAEYKQNEARNALGVIDINLRNENKLNQFAARALGWSSFEALEVQLRRADQCQHSFLVESVIFDDIPFFLVRANNRIFWINRHNMLITTRESQTANFIDLPMQEMYEQVTLSDAQPIERMTMTDAGDDYVTFVATIGDTEDAMCFKRIGNEIRLTVVFDYLGNSGSLSEHTWTVNQDETHYATPHNITYQGVVKAEFDKRTYT